MTVKLTIIGLGQIGGSIGLALANQIHQLKRVGHDRSVLTTREAEKMGAIDQVETNLHRAVEDADIVILAVPVDEIRGVLDEIIPDLKEEVLLVDTSPIKSQVNRWVGEMLGEKRYFVSLTPSINPAYLHDTGSGLEAAHADLFKNSLMVVTSPTGTSPDAIKLALDLVALLDATPLFADADESDGLKAAGHMLPQLAAAALVNATIDQPGWTEGRKLASSAYAKVTEPVLHLDDTYRLGQAVLMNRENIVRVIDNLIASLTDLRQAAAEEDADKLHSLLEHARDGRMDWWKQRQTSNWEATVPRAEMPAKGEFLKRFFGLGLFGRKEKK
jgi:prephenate dehydrogenase